MAEEVSRAELEAAHAWDEVDRVPGRSSMTAYRRRLRYHQARWREAQGLPIGTQPIVPQAGKPARAVGSRIPLELGRSTGANFLGPAAFAAAEARWSVKEPQQSVDWQGLWADLLSSFALGCNLFGELAADLGRADRAVHTWWPSAPGRVVDVLFAHSPGRLDPAFLGNLMAFDTAFVLDAGDGTQAVVAVDVKYHDRLKRHWPKPQRLARYLEVAARSGAFGPSAIEAGNGTDLLEMWLEHLLVLSMLQHPSRAWSWGVYVVVHPRASPDFAEGCDRYRGHLRDDATFATATLEDLLDAKVLPRRSTAALRERYLPD